MFCQLCIWKERNTYKEYTNKSNTMNYIKDTTQKALYGMAWIEQTLAIIWTMLEVKTPKWSWEDSDLYNNMHMYRISPDK